MRAWYQSNEEAISKKAHDLEAEAVEERNFELMAAEAAQKLLELPKVVRELHKEAHKRDEQNTRLMEDKIVWNQAIGKTNKKAINAGGKRRGADLRQSLGSERYVLIGLARCFVLTAMLTFAQTNQEKQRQEQKSCDTG